MTYKESSCKKTDKCHICGKEKILTWEHLPPKSSGNKSTVKYYTMNEFLSDDVLSGEKTLEEKRFHISQGGLRKKTICGDCNSYTGKYYVPAYSNFANKIKCGLLNIDQVKSLNHMLQIECKLKPLNFIKEVIAMFCSLLPNETVDIYKFGEFVLDRNEKEFANNDFELYMYLSVTKNGILKFSSPSATCEFGNREQIFCSEISAPPFGFIMSINPKKGLKLPSIKNMCSYNIDDEIEFKFSLPLLKPNTILPLSYERYYLV